MQYSRLLSVLLVSANATLLACAHTTSLPDQPALATRASSTEHVFTIVSDTLRIDTTYHSMEGPYHQVQFTIGGEQVDTVWVTAMSADVVAPDMSPLPVEFFCHANLDYDPALHREMFKSARITSARLFTLSQGNEVMRFPDGFGIPVRTDEPLSLTTQVLSNNGVDAAKNVRVRIKVHYVRKGERPMKALFLTSAVGVVATEGHKGHYGMHEGHDMGASTAGVAKAGVEYRDTLGQRFSGHWIVPPGKHRFRSVVTEWLKLDRDTRIHYIGVHVHPFAQQITLRDLTTGEEVFTSRITPLVGRIGIAKVTDFSSPTGLVLRAKHHYELIADYDNPTGKNADAMAVLFMYVRDQQLKAMEKP